MTFNQAKLLGAKIRNGEKSTVVFYAGTIDNTKEEESNNDKKIQNVEYRRFLKLYRVFNANQIENLPEKYYLKEKKNELIEKSSKMEQFIKNTNANIQHKGELAYYTEESDCIIIPEIQFFKDNNAYYSTLCHELVHWTKNKKRLNRNLFSKRFGDSGYAMEELVADIGSAFVCSSLRIKPDIRGDHAPYIASWLSVLKSDKKAIFYAASLAQKASNYLLELR